MRLDKALTELHESVSRKHAVDLIKAGRVFVNDVATTKPSYAIDLEIQEIRIEGDLPTAMPTMAEPNADIQLDILHEDDAIAVLNKPGGLSVHPSQHHHADTLVNGIVAHWPHLDPSANPLIGENPLRPSVVHRLDKDTSGVIVIAKTQDAYQSLKDQFQTRAVTKTYLALVHDPIRQDGGTLSAPIGRSKADPRKLTAVTKLIHTPKPAITEWIHKGTYTHEDSLFTLVELTPKTGRTHQLRVHLQSIHHSIAHDTVYSSNKQQLLAQNAGVPRLFLHAQSLTFTHPDSEELVTFKAPLAPELKTVLDNLESIELS